MEPLSHHQKTLVALALLPVYFVCLVNGFYDGPLSTFSTKLFWAADFLQWVVLPVLLMIALHADGVGPAHYFQGWRVSRDGFSVLLQGLVAAILIGCVERYVRELSWKVAGYPQPYFSFSDLLPNNAWRWIRSTYSALTAGVVESLFFIGLPWALCRDRMRKRKMLFAFAVSVVFGLGHWEQGIHGVLAAFTANVCFCAWFFLSRSLWPVIIAHTLIDLAIFA